LVEECVMGSTDPVCLHVCVSVWQMPTLLGIFAVRWLMRRASTFLGAAVCTFHPIHLSIAYPTVSSGSCIWDFTLAEWIISVFCRQSYTNAWSAQVRKMRAQPECWEKPERTRKLSERKLMRCAGENISHCFLKNSSKNLLN